MLLCLIIVVLILCLLLGYDQEEFTEMDQRNATEAASYLENIMKKCIQPDEISDEELQRNKDNVAMIKTPKSNEGITFFNPISKDTWPNSYYSNFTPARDAAPGQFNKLFQWTPGFSSTSNWQWWVRPGVTFSPYPRARWVRNNGSFYFLNNEGMTEPDKRLMPAEYDKEVLKEGYDDINRFRSPDRRASCCGCAG